MVKGNTQLRNLQGNPVPTYYIDAYAEWDEVEEGLIKQKREAINDIIKTKKSFCCKRTVVECLMPIKIDEKEIIAEQQFLTDKSVQTLEQDLCEILDAEQIDETNDFLSSTHMNMATIVCKNDLIMAVTDDNEHNIAVTFIPSIDTDHIVSVQEKFEYINTARTACNHAMKEFHKRWKTKLSKRTGAWTSMQMSEETFENEADYGF